MSVADQNSTSEDEIDLRDLIGTLIVGRWTIVVAIAVCFLAALTYVTLTAPTYRASALLELEPKNGGLALPSEMKDLLGDTDSRVLTEVEIIRSRVVLQQVVDELRLDVIAVPHRLPVIGNALARFDLPDPGFSVLRPFAWSQESIEIGELAVPEGWLDAEMTLTSLGDGRYSISLPDGRTAEGEVAKPLDLQEAGFSLRVNALEAAAGREFTILKIAPEVAVNDLRAKLSVVETVRQSSVLKLDFVGRDRVLTTRIMDSILQAYLGQNVSRGSAEAEQSLEFVNSQLPVSQDAVATAQNALNEYRQKQKSVDLTYETQALLSRQTEIEQKLAELALQEQDYKQRFTENHPTYEALLQNRAKLNEQLDDLKSESGNLPETQKEVFNLTRNLEVAQNVYLALLNRQQELQVVRASVVGNVRVLDGAFTPPESIAPAKALILVGSLLLGFVFGAAIVLVRRMFNAGVTGSEQLEKLGLPVFATVGLSQAVGPTSGRHRLPILAVEAPTDLVVEAMRSLRTSLHFGLLDAKTRSILITSAAPGAGKSFTAVNLAVVAAEAGQRVCLIDADMRRGYLRKYFDLDRSAIGLAGYLAGDVPLEQAIRPTKTAGLDFMPTGPLPPNPAELLMRRSFSEMLDTLNDKYDLILVDAPPTLAVTDPVIMGRSVGAVIMVVRYNQTAVGEVAAVIRSYETAGGRVSGAILNGVEAHSMSYGNKYYYYNKRYEYKSKD